MNETNLVRMEGRRSDEEIARDLRARLVAALKPVGELMEEAKRSGLVLSFQMVADQYGHSLPMVSIAKPL